VRERRTPHEPTEGRTPDHASALGGEHQPVLPRRIPPHVLGERQRDRARQRHGPTAALRLRRTLDQTIGLDALLLDADHVSNKVEAVDAQRDQFAPAQRGVGGGQNERAVAVGHGLNE
jgi:hypothetical protein